MQILFLQDTKLRNYWLWSSTPDKGKSTFLKNTCAKYKAQIFNANQQSFNEIHASTQIICFDTVRLSPDEKVFPPRWDDIEKISDGTYKFKKLYEGY